MIHQQAPPPNDTPHSSPSPSPTCAAVLIISAVWSSVSLERRCRVAEGSPTVESQQMLRMAEQY